MEYLNRSYVSAGIKLASLQINVRGIPVTRDRCWSSFPIPSSQRPFFPKENIPKSHFFPKQRISKIYFSQKKVFPKRSFYNIPQVFSCETSSLNYNHASLRQCGITVATRRGAEHQPRTQ